MNIDRVPLFPSNLYVKHIDPDSFNKKDIIDTVIRNYAVQQQRNEWDDSSNMHHYYNDWNNDAFEKVNLEAVTNIYKAVYQEILDSTFNAPIRFNVSMENITVHKGNDTYMSSHNHINEYVYLSSVHYIKCDEKSSALTFVNPLIYSHYPNVPTYSVTKSALDSSNTNNSSYFTEWNYSVKEDELIIFPSYLYHRVKPSSFVDSDFRIAIVTNLQIFLPTE